MDLSTLYNQTQELCNLFEKRKRFTDLVQRKDIRQNKINRLVQTIIRRCPVACEFAMKNNFFYRGTERQSSDIQYVKPSLSRRMSRDNKNIWNVLFDNGPYTKQHQKRQYSLMFSTNESTAEEFGQILYVFPVGNPLITYSPEDFIETIPIGKMETSLSEMIGDLKIKDTYKQYLREYIRYGKSYQRFIKILNFIQKAPIDDSKYLQGRFPWDRDERKKYMKSKLDGSLTETLLEDLSSPQIETMRLSEFDYFDDSRDEVWTMSPCYIVDEDMVYKIKTTLYDMKNNDN